MIEALTLGGGGAGSLGNNNATGMLSADDFNDSTSTTLPLTFSKGYDAFYCMKYEISQGQYRDFLNTLTRDQQNKRTYTDVSTDAITNTYVMADNSSMQNRNGIRCPSTGNGTTEPITFGCDYNGASTFDEVTDGQWIACNYLSWMDGCAYADWAGLRPMTELEFEKVCRGPVTPVADEYAWGTTDLTQAEGAVQNPGENNEVAATTGNGLANYDGAGTDISGPLRVGFAAASATNRVSAGSGYYGNMNMSDNLWERAVTVGSSTGRVFIGTNGDGLLTTTASNEGNATNSDWPGIDDTPTNGITGASGSGFRGGYWGISAGRLQVSLRTNAAYTSTSRSLSYGFRLVR